MKYIYSNFSSSGGVEKKIARQCRLLDINTEEIVSLNFWVSCKFILRNWFVSDRSPVYLREGLLANIVIACCFCPDNLILELNRPLSSIKGRRSTFILKIRRYFLKLLIVKAQKIVCVSSEIHGSLSEHAKHKSVVFENFFGFLDVESTNRKIDVSKKFDLVLVADLNQSWQARDFLESYLLKFSDRTLLHIGSGNLVAPNATSVGYLSDPLQLTNCISGARVAISQLGLKRIGLTQATPLKHVDYVNCGLPIISGATDQLLNDCYPIFELKSECVNDLEQLVLLALRAGSEPNLLELTRKLSTYSDKFRNFCLG